MGLNELAWGWNACMAEQSAAEPDAAQQGAQHAFRLHPQQPLMRAWVCSKAETGIGTLATHLIHIFSTTPLRPMSPFGSVDVAVMEWNGASPACKMTPLNAASGFPPHLCVLSWKQPCCGAQRIGHGVCHAPARMTNDKSNESSPHWAHKQGPPNTGTAQ